MVYLATPTGVKVLLQVLDVTLGMWDIPSQAFLYQHLYEATKGSYERALSSWSPQDVLGVVH